MVRELCRDGRFICPKDAASGWGIGWASASLPVGLNLRLANAVKGEDGHVDWHGRRVFDLLLQGVNPR
ncbi:MAG TPA: hypothetical protein VF447_02985, partial [Terriglobales bacterium]